MEQSSASAPATAVRHPPGWARLGALLGSPAFAWAAVATGAGLRVAQYASGRSLWLDEAFLALNVLDRPFSSLFGRLDFAQGAPPGFLLAERVVTDVLGPSEASLRLVPLVAGVCSLPLFLVVARSVLPRAASGAAIALFAVLGGPIYYSAEAKQYSLDVCGAIGALALGVVVLERPLSGRATAVLALAGALGVWVSHAALLTLAGVGASLLLLALLAHDRQRALRLAFALAVWGASALGVYVVNVSRLANRGAGGGYDALPFPPTSSHDVVELARQANGQLADGVALGLPPLLSLVAAALLVLGVVSLARVRPERLLLLLAPIAVTVVAVRITAPGALWAETTW